MNVKKSKPQQVAAVLFAQIIGKHRAARQAFRDTRARQRRLKSSTPTSSLCGGGRDETSSIGKRHYVRHRAAVSIPSPSPTLSGGHHGCAAGGVVIGSAMRRWVGWRWSGALMKFTVSTRAGFSAASSQKLPSKDPSFAFRPGHPIMSATRSTTAVSGRA